MLREKIQTGLNEKYDLFLATKWGAVKPAAKVRVRIFVCLAILVYVLVGITDGGDMDVCLDAAKRLSLGQNPFKPIFYKGMGYTYGPLFAFLLSPWAKLPFYVWDTVFNFLNIFFIYKSWRIIEKSLGIKLSLGQTLIILFITLRFVLSNFAMIQMTPLLLFGCLQALVWDAKGKYVSVGLLIGILIDIKVLPLIMVGWFGLKGRFASLLSITLFSVAWAFLPSLFLGFSRNYALLFSWFSAINPTTSSRSFELGLSTHGLPSLIPALLTSMDGDLSLRRNVLFLSSDSLKLVLRLSQVGILALISLRILPWFTKKPFGAAPNRIELIDFSLFMTAVPLIAPQQQKYAFLFVAPLIVCTLYDLYYTRNRRTFALSLFGLTAWLLGSVLSDTLYLGVALNEITQHYKTITWATLILFFTNLAKPRTFLG